MHTVLESQGTVEVFRSDKINNPSTLLFMPPSCRLNKTWKPSHTLISRTDHFFWHLSMWRNSDLLLSSEAKPPCRRNRFWEHLILPFNAQRQKPDSEMQSNFRGPSFHFDAKWQSEKQCDAKIASARKKGTSSVGEKKINILKWLRRSILLWPHHYISYLVCVIHNIYYNYRTRTMFFINLFRSWHYNSNSLWRDKFRFFFSANTMCWLVYILCVDESIFISLFSPCTNNFLEFEFRWWPLLWIGSLKKCDYPVKARGMVVMHVGVSWSFIPSNPLLIRVR